MGSPAVVSGALAACSMGAAPASLMFLPAPIVMAGTQAGTIVNMIPFLNIMPFGMCIAPANPAVIAATTAAMGTPTPGACIPTPAGPWSPGSTKAVMGGIPMLTASSTLSCSFGGSITVSFSGQTICMV